MYGTNEYTGQILYITYIQLTICGILHIIIKKFNKEVSDYRVKARRNLEPLA